MFRAGGSTVNTCHIVQEDEWRLTYGINAYERFQLDLYMYLED